MQTGDGVGRWTLSHVIGVGGSSAVWLARTTEFEFAAVKVLEELGVPHRRQRFEREIEFLHAEAAAPGVLPLLDHGHTRPRANGSRWYAMPYAQRLDEVLGTRPDAATTLAAFVDYAATLAELHGRGIGHRDLNRTNLYSHDGRWLIADFGFAHLPGDDPLNADARGRGITDSMAPEQQADIGGAPFAPVDVYALATTLWSALAGWMEPPVVRPVALSVADAVNEVLTAATAADPMSRPTMAELHDTLSECRR